MGIEGIPVRVEIASVLGLLLVLSVGGLAPIAAAEPVTIAEATAVLRDASGSLVGFAKFTQEDDAVLIRATAHGLPPGFHGFHVHSIGNCTAPFTSAGGHFNPAGKGHGEHAGDLPAILVNNDGTAHASFTRDRFMVADLFDGDGSALIVHALADNYANIPSRYAPLGPDSTTLATGDAGARIVCGVLEPGGRGGTVSRAGEGSARALLRNADGNPVGVVHLTALDGAVLVRVVVHDLPPGFHGFHVHAVGNCTAPFTSAAGHFNPAGTTHGGHAGDLPVLLVNADGTTHARFTTGRFTIADLFDGDGSAFIVHALPDNYGNIPTRYAAAPDSTTLATGDAGGRIACGVVS